MLACAWKNDLFKPIKSKFRLRKKVEMVRERCCSLVINYFREANYAADG